MKVAKIILAFVLICMIGLGIITYLNPDGFAYGRFKRQTSSYYSQLAHACDSLLQQHQTFSKHSFSGQKEKGEFLVWADTNGIFWDEIKIAGDDPSLPKVIRKLHPHKILLEPNRIWIGIGLRPDFAIIWGKSEIRTNTWTLVTNGEGMETPLYSEGRQN